MNAICNHHRMASKPRASRCSHCAVHRRGWVSIHACFNEKKTWTQKTNTPTKLRVVWKSLLFHLEIQGFSLFPPNFSRDALQTTTYLAINQTRVIIGVIFSFFFSSIRSGTAFKSIIEIDIAQSVRTPCDSSQKVPPLHKNDPTTKIQIIWSRADSSLCHYDAISSLLCAL